MRAWLHSVIETDPVLAEPEAAGGLGVEGEVFAGHSLLDTPDHKPFVVHQMGNNTSERMSDEYSPQRQFVTIYVHDEGRSYIRIDRIIARLKVILDNAPGSAADGVMTAHYLETSQDLEDDQMGTIVKFIRFQLIGT
jgi:hypothetical protein